MAYVGGKSRGFEHITSILNAPCFDNMDYVEPFVGYAHILRRIKNKRSVAASDSNRLLITLLSNVKNGGEHPVIDADEYAKLRKRYRENGRTDDVRMAYAAFCYSYNGKEFGGYTGEKHGRNYPRERMTYYDTKLRTSPAFNACSLECKDYKLLEPSGCVVYCDPPYANTTDYKSDFDHGEFWDTMRSWSRKNAVFISEYTAPDDFVLLTQCVKLSSLAGKGASDARIEKLFVHKSFLNTHFYRELRSQKYI